MFEICIWWCNNSRWNFQILCQNRIISLEKVHSSNLILRHFFDFGTNLNLRKQLSIFPRGQRWRNLFLLGKVNFENILTFSTFLSHWLRDSFEEGESQEHIHFFHSWLLVYAFPDKKFRVECRGKFEAEKFCTFCS